MGEAVTTGEPGAPASVDAVAPAPLDPASDPPSSDTDDHSPVEPECPPSPDEARGRGRPRAADRTESILRAADDLFDEVGYDQLTVQAIAARAGVGLATIYRRWPTKQALLAEVLRRRRDRFAVADGPPEQALASLFELIARTTLGRQREFLPGLLAAIRSDDELATALGTGVIDPLRAFIREQLALLLGPDHPQLDLLADLLPGVCVYRAFAPGDPGDPELLVAQVLELVATLAHPPPPGR